jgi:aspartate dehydrogenase
LGITIDKETILYEGKASDAVRKFPRNMNVAATLSIVCNRDVDVKVIADPTVDSNCHEIKVVGDFGELKTTTHNTSCITNPKTSVLAAYSVIKLLKNLNENLKVGS